MSWMNSWAWRLELFCVAWGQRASGLNLWWGAAHFELSVAVEKSERTFQTEFCPFKSFITVSFRNIYTHISIESFSHSRMSSADHFHLVRIAWISRFPKCPLMLSVLQCNWLVSRCYFPLTLHSCSRTLWRSMIVRVKSYKLEKYDYSSQVSNS